MKTIRYLFNLLNKNKSTIILFIFGLILISLIIYNRIFRSRESVDIILEFNFWKVLLYSSLVLMNLFHLLRLILQLFLVRRKINLEKIPKYKSPWHRLLLKSLTAFLSLNVKSFETVYLYGVKKIRKIDQVYDHCCYFFLRHDSLITYGFVIFILFCQCIVITSLVLDVFYFHRFHWFYKSLILLLGPILSKVFFYCLLDYVRGGLKKMENYAHAVYNNETEEWTYTWRHDAPSEYDPENLHQLSRSHSSLHNVQNMIEWIKYHIQYWYIAKLFHGSKFVLYIITWGYLVFLMISG